ncbi:hypothetical protein M413DRAFT_20729 [Hebeloma cylindrosporum]|uniref:Yeast cell wall synthesis Kre9/Knh1-like N-terminal domain-containing protein n=1 Tax=Hebeloma cylindrosporum TaxID=76867 RepID=A0A0C3BFX8_HEBCY|nr:hypothetical protein M413DRAFT_20729 [Hebeloma cylindrosporum h7]
MFSKLCALALVAPLASALILSIPEAPTSGGQMTIKWTNEPNDPETWSFELINTAFNNAFAIANNVNPSASSLTLTIPIVPVGDGYTLQAVNIGDINQVYATTGSFSIGASSTSTTSASTAASSGSSVSGSTLVTGSTTSSRSSNTAVSGSSTNTSPSTSATAATRSAIPLALPPFIT